MAKILVADDERDIRDLISITLQFGGHDVTTAKDGQEAVEYASAAEFDLILLDWRMPRMTGYEASLTLRDMEKTKETPILFLSGKGHDEVGSLNDISQTYYLLKPFAPDALIAKLNQILNQ